MRQESLFLAEVALKQRAFTRRRPRKAVHRSSMTGRSADMFEFFFTISAGFLAYIAFDASKAIGRVNRGEPALAPKPKAPAAPKATKPAAQKPIAAKEKPVAEKKAPTPKVTAAPAPTAKPATKAKAAAAKPVAAEPVKLADQLKNPATGEVTPVPANYRFAKKWVKDALVSEKLLDRVYKPNELDAAADLKIKAAMDKLRAIKKYQA